MVVRIAVVLRLSRAGMSLLQRGRGLVGSRAGVRGRLTTRTRERIPSPRRGCSSDALVAAVARGRTGSLAIRVRRGLRRSRDGRETTRLAPGRRNPEGFGENTAGGYRRRWWSSIVARRRRNGRQGRLSALATVAVMLFGGARGELPG